jgi:hypothetical protein
VSIFDVRLRVCAQHALNAWWYCDQFAEFLNTAFRLNHPAGKGNTLPQVLTAFRVRLALRPFGPLFRQAKAASKWIDERSSGVQNRPILVGNFSNFT